MNNTPSNLRKSPRADFHDYNGGDYFITCVTHNRNPYFGYIYNNKNILSEEGKMLRLCIENYKSKYGEIIHYVIMPDHVHLIVRILDFSQNAHNRNNMPLCIFIGTLKKIVSFRLKKINSEFKWQRSFNDRIIRNLYEGALISKYIDGNIANFDPH